MIRYALPVLLIATPATAQTVTVMQMSECAGLPWKDQASVIF